MDEQITYTIDIRSERQKAIDDMPVRISQIGMTLGAVLENLHSVEERLARIEAKLDAFAKPARPKTILATTRQMSPEEWEKYEADARRLFPDEVFA